jgi:hypothetical protein
MSVALLTDPSSLPAKPLKSCTKTGEDRLALLGGTGTICGSRRAARSVEPTAIAPGQLWLIEVSATEPNLSPLEHQALTTANVVLYDRALASTVARVLPLGGYAEPAPLSDTGPDRASQRCLHFVRDGWSVVRLIEYDYPGYERAECSRLLSARFLAAKVPPDLPVFVFSDTGGSCQHFETRLAALGSFIDRHTGAERVSIVFTAIGAGTGRRHPVVLFNGLAG